MKILMIFNQIKHLEDEKKFIYICDPVCILTVVYFL